MTGHKWEEKCELYQTWLSLNKEAKDKHKERKREVVKYVRCVTFRRRKKGLQI